MELIDRQALIEHLKIHCDGCGEALHCAFEAPTVDAVPVVHGRWVAIDEDCEALDGETESKRWGCTNCHEIVEYDDYTHIQRLSPYCPNCGAKMDRGAEDG